MVNERWAVRSVARGDPGDVQTASGGLHEGGRAGAGVGAGPRCRRGGPQTEVLQWNWPNPSCQVAFDESASPMR